MHRTDVQLQTVFSEQVICSSAEQISQKVLEIICVPDVLFVSSLKAGGNNLEDSLQLFLSGLALEDSLVFPTCFTEREGTTKVSLPVPDLLSCG